MCLMKIIDETKTSLRKIDSILRIHQLVILPGTMPWLRIWAPYLNKEVSPSARRAIKEKAKAEDKCMVKVTINKTTGKKSVMGP